MSPCIAEYNTGAGAQGLPTRADSLSHSLAVSAAIGGSCLESDVQAAENIEHIAKKVGALPCPAYSLFDVMYSAAS